MRKENNKPTGKNETVRLALKIMKYGIYYAYWEKEWGGNFLPYIKKCAELGFDALEVACGAFHLSDDQTFRELISMAQD